MERTHNTNKRTPRPSIARSVRSYVRPHARPSVGRSVRPSIDPSTHQSVDSLRPDRGEVQHLDGAVSQRLRRRRVRPAHARRRHGVHHAAGERGGGGEKKNARRGETPVGNVCIYIRIYGWLPTRRLRLGCLAGAKCEFCFCILGCPVSGLASYKCHVLLRVSVTFCSSLLHTSWGKNTFRMPLSSAPFCTPEEALSSSDVTYPYVLLFTSPRKGNRGATDCLCLFYQDGTK